MVTVTFSFNAEWWEWLVWAGEILFVFGLLLIIELIIHKKEFRKSIIWKSLLSAILIIVFVVVTGWVAAFFIFDNGQSLFPLSVVLTFALTILLIHGWLEPQHFKISLAISTFILLVVYLVRILANISLYLT